LKDIRQKLLATFQVECREHIGHIRALLTALEKGEEAPPGGLDEVFRRAHSLKGAARAVDLRPVERTAHRLETLFSRVREGALSLDGEVSGVIRLTLDAIEDDTAALGEGRTPPETSRATEAVERLLGIAPEARAQPPDAPASAGPLQPAETVRVSAENLDRLLRSSGQLLTETMRQGLVAERLKQLSRQVAGVEREWERVRKASAASLRRLNATPEFARVGRYLDFVEHQMRLLSGQARAAHLLQQRASWSVRHLSEQVREDVRRARMVPAEGVFEGFRKMVRDLARDEGKEVAFEVSGLEAEADRMVLQALKDPVMHLLRNAVSHGIESPDDRRAKGRPLTGRVALRVEARGNRLRIAAEDDGRGIDLKRVAEVAVRRGLLSESEAAAAPPQELTRLIFQPGFSTARAVTELSGRGMGLSVAYEAVTRLQGEIALRHREGPGTAVVLSVPLTVSTHRLLLVACQGQTFGIPAHGVERLHRVQTQEVETVEGRPVVRLQGQPVPLASLAHLLGLGEPAVSVEGGALPVVALKSGDRRLAVAVDALLSVQDSLIQDLGTPVEGADRLSGGVLLEDGSVCLALNPAGLFRAFQGSGGAPALRTTGPAPEKGTPAILVVDDSITTRTLEKSILEAHGYQVQVAVDGAEALDRLRAERVDLVVADIQMPRVDGFALLQEMKKDQRLAQIPVILVTSMERREDQERGLALGADAYIVKRKFDQRELLEAIEQMV
jgi:two-component system chemotaxis sensor kinase CheA